MGHGHLISYGYGHMAGYLWYCIVCDSLACDSHSEIYLDTPFLDRDLQSFFILDICLQVKIPVGRNPPPKYLTQIKLFFR